MYVRDPSTTFSELFQNADLFEKPDLLLNMNYTVTRLEVAFLMIVSRELLWRRVMFKGTALPAGLNVKLGSCVFIYTYCICPRWMVILCWLLTTAHLSWAEKLLPVFSLLRRKELIHGDVLFQWYDWSGHEVYCLWWIKNSIYSLWKYKRFKTLDQMQIYCVHQAVYNCKPQHFAFDYREMTEKTI